MKISKVMIIMLIISIMASFFGCRCSSPDLRINALKINEIMYDPFGDDAGNEWLEIYNNDPLAVNLANFKIYNKEQELIATLPSWDLPPQSFLIVMFGTGNNESDFNGGYGVFYTQTNSAVLNNTEEELALYNGAAKTTNLADFVSWCSDNNYVPGNNHDIAVKAAKWEKDAFFDIGYPSGNSLVAGFSIGRDKNATDTDSPIDWAPNGGYNAYFETPGMVNAGPYFSTDWGTKLVQTKANQVLILFGHEVNLAGHEVIEETQSDTESYIKATHTFETTYAGIQNTFSGIGEYRWVRTDADTWQDEIQLSIAGSSGSEIYLVEYSREYKNLGLSLVITEDLTGTYQYEVTATDEIPADIDPLIEPVPEVVTRPENKQIIDHTVTTITQVGLNEYKVETVCNKDLAFRNEKQTLVFNKNYTIVSDEEIQAATELEITSDSREGIKINTTYVMNTDIGWHKAHDLGNIDVAYSQYNMTVGNQAYVMSEPSYYRMTQRPGQEYYDIDCNIVLDGTKPTTIGCEGYTERLIENGEVIYRGEMRDKADVGVQKFYIDGWESAVGGGVCAIAGGLIGLIWVGVGSVVGAGVGAAGCGAVGAAIESATEPDKTKPEIEWEILESGSDKDKGWMKVKVTVSDNEGVAEWGLSATNQDGQTLANRSYDDKAKSVSRTFPLVNKRCVPRTFNLTVTVTDTSGNVRRDSRQFTVPARICTPNVKETSPADKDVSVPVTGKTQVTFCKPMETQATNQAFVITPGIDYRVEWSYYNMIATIIPTNPLEYGTTYTITITTDALSYAGYNLEEPYTFSFTTVELTLPPELISITPASDSEIPATTTQFALLFSESMNTDLTSDAITIFPNVPYEITWEVNNRLMIITLLEPLAPDTQYDIMLFSTAVSEAGLALENDYILSYHTSAEAPSPPVIISVIPESGTEIPAATTQITLLFSKPMNATLTSAAVHILPEVAYEITWEADNQLMVITFLEPLEPDTQYDIIITGTAVAEDGLIMESDIILTFHTLP